jgi:hypothetical protein
MLSEHDDSRRRVAGVAYDRSPSHDGGSMVDFILMNGKSPKIESA